jgi:transcriptional regulator with XRE-family HTH domain
MGHHRPKTPRLGEKLRQIRKRIKGGLTQNEMVKCLRLEKDFDQERISKYERGVLEPPVYVLIAYSDVTNLPLDVILRGEHDIPSELPVQRKQQITSKEGRSEKKRQ